MKLDDGLELRDVIQGLKKQRKLLLFTKGRNWWLLLPPRRVRFDGTKKSWMQVISSSDPELPSDVGTDYYELHYDYRDTYLGIDRKGIILVSLQEPKGHSDMPENAELGLEHYIHSLEPKGVLKLTGVDREDLPLYMENPRGICEIILKGV